MTWASRVDTFAAVKNVFPHRFELAVYFADTDAGGVVYHARYLEFFERARFELFRALDAGPLNPSTENGGYVVSDVSAKFKKPARLGERIAVESTPLEVKRVSFRLRQRAVSASTGVVFCEAEVNVVRINGDWKPAALSPGLLAGLKAGLPAS
ncbi:MAG: thioesterase family protein [Pseudomonadota bacterium]